MTKYELTEQYCKNIVIGNIQVMLHKLEEPVPTFKQFNQSTLIELHEIEELTIQALS